MIYQLALPVVGNDIEEFRVLDWSVEAGQPFNAGDLLIELETHKAVVEVRAGQAGVFRKALVEAGNWCRIGLPLGLFGDDPVEELPSEPSLAGDLLVDFEIT